MEPLTLSLNNQFEIAKYQRLIEATEDVATLRGFATTLLQAWATQKAATQWVMRESLNAPPKVTPESLSSLEEV